MRAVLTVLSVAYPFARVTADPVGGAEQVLAALDRALVAAGHRSLVIAPDGSEVAGELVPLPAVPGEIDDAARATTHALVSAAISITLRGERVDIVHLHGLDFAAYLPPPGVPALATMHLPLDWYAPEALRSGVALVPVSDDQARRAPPGVDLQPAIPNGVDLDAYRPGGPKGDYALVLGRVAREKGFPDALDAARLAGVPLRAAGEVYPYPDHRRHFEQDIAPRLDAERLWLGPVVGAAKRKLLAEAHCLLVPSTAPETSSLVAMEALASGTPVIAYRAGALPDIVEDGVTGFLVEGADAMAAAIGRTDAIDPAACRRAAVERFDQRRTVAAYLDLYARLVA